MLPHVILPFYHPTSLEDAKRVFYSLLTFAPHSLSGQDQIQPHDNAVQHTLSLLTNVCELHQVAVQAGDDQLSEPSNGDHSECNSSSSLDEDADNDVGNGIGADIEV